MNEQQIKQLKHERDLWRQNAKQLASALVELEYLARQEIPCYQHQKLNCVTDAVASYTELVAAMPNEKS